MFNNTPPSGAAVEQTFQPGLIPTWSYSALKTFEKVPYKLYVQKVLKIKDEGNQFTRRGSEIHDSAEAFVKGESDDLHKSLDKWENPIKQLRERRENSPGSIVVEDDWGFNVDWEPTGWMASDVWLRMKLDVLIKESEKSMKVIDYKTGRPPSMVGMEHSEQAILYALGTFLRFPEVDFVKCEWWYVDHPPGTKLEKSYTREQAMKFFYIFDQRAKAMTSATEEAFAPNQAPNGLPKYVQDFLANPDNYPPESPFVMPEWAKV